MTEPKVLHRIQSSFYAVSGNLDNPRVLNPGEESERPDFGIERLLAREILRLNARTRELRELLDGAMSSSESAKERGRAEGRLEGVRKAAELTGFAKSDEDPNEWSDEKSEGYALGRSDARRVIDQSIAAAERELAGGEEADGEE